MGTTNYDTVAADFVGNLTGDVTGDLTGQTFGTVSTYDADGAIALTDKLALLDASEASTAMTLAAGTAGTSTLCLSRTGQAGTL